MRHTLSAHDRARNFHAAFIAYDALIAHAFILSTIALPVLNWPEDALGKKSVFFGTLRAIVNRLGFYDFAVGPAPYLFRRGELKPYGSKIIYHRIRFSLVYNLAA